jgi:hypothetical protein
MESGAELVGRLQGICGAEQVLTHPDALATYRSDGLAHYRQTPLVAVLPGSAEEVQATCASWGIRSRSSIPWSSCGARSRRDGVGSQSHE